MADNTVEVAEGFTADVFHQILDLAIKGKGKLPGAKSTANELLRSLNDPEAAVGRTVANHIALAGGQGFATNWGGFLVALVTVPANLAASTFVQARMVACVAHLRGYNLDDPRVRTAILMVMLGPNAGDKLIKQGVLPSSPAMVATAPVFDAKLDGSVSRALLERAMNFVGGKRLGVTIAKKIPIIGGGVGAAVDGVLTHGIAQYAVAALPSRRPRLTATA